MPQYLLLGLIAFSTLVTLGNWRSGLLFFILIGVLQDPIRKITPGTSALFVLSTAPVWAAMIIGISGREKSPWHVFKMCHPQLAGAMAIFAISLIPAGIISLGYDTGGLQLALMGAFSFYGAIISMLIGFTYITTTDDLIKVFKYYCILVSIALIGTPLEYLGLFKEWGALGTATLGTTWTRYFPGYTLYMISGFFRSPDVMGWHSAALVMIATAIALVQRGATRMVWMGLAGWGIFGLMMCGRRKMMYMLPIYVLIILWIQSRRHGRRGKILGIISVTALLGYFVYQHFGPSETVNEYYVGHTTAEVKGRIFSDSIDALENTWDQSGFWGTGLGSASQGRQHIKMKALRNWQEGGLDRLLTELGVPGFIASIIVGLVLIKTIFQTIMKVDVQQKDIPLFAGLAGLVLANGGSFIVSHQIFGDPFINCFFSINIGFFLSIKRMGMPALPAPKDKPNPATYPRSI